MDARELNEEIQDLAGEVGRGGTGRGSGTGSAGHRGRPGLRGRGRIPWTEARRPQQGEDGQRKHLADLCSHGWHLEVTTLLLDRGADPNKARTDTGETPLIMASWKGHLEVAQLLAVFGADLNAVNSNEDNALASAGVNGNNTVANFPEAVATWPAFKIAADCRLHTAAKSALFLGAIDPAGCTVGELTAATSRGANVLWPGSPVACPLTTALAKAVHTGWSPERHFLYHNGVRATVHTMLLALSCRASCAWWFAVSCSDRCCAVSITQMCCKVLECWHRQY